MDAKWDSATTQLGLVTDGLVVAALGSWFKTLLDAMTAVPREGDESLEGAERAIEAREQSRKVLRALLRLHFPAHDTWEEVRIGVVGCVYGLSGHREGSARTVQRLCSRSHIAVRSF